MRILRPLVTLFALAACAAPLTPVAAQSLDTAKLRKARIEVDSLKALVSPALKQYCATKAPAGYVKAACPVYLRQVAAIDSNLLMVAIPAPSLPPATSPNTPPVNPPPTTMTTDTTPKPPPSPGHPNEPAGFAQLSPTLTGDVVPPTQPAYVPRSANEIGWIQSGNVSGSVSQVVDPSSPEDSRNVLRIPFPAGGGNGSAPGMAYAMSSTNPQRWPAGPREIYISYWYKVSPNFPASLNADKMIYGQIGNNENGTVGNKLVYLINGQADWRFTGAVDASPVVFDPNHGTPYNTPMYPTIAVQNIVSVDGVQDVTIVLNQNWTGDWSLRKYQKRGVWHHHEVYAKANTPGNEDGTVKVWFDGLLIINYTNRIKWSNNPTQDKWWTMFWDPVYNNMIPLDASNAYHQLKNLYVSGKPQ